MLEYKEFNRIVKLRKLLKDSYGGNAFIDFLISIKNSHYKSENVGDYIYYYPNYEGRELLFYKKLKNKNERNYNIRATSEFYDEFDIKYIHSYGKTDYFKYTSYKSSFIESFLEDLEQDINYDKI